MFDFTTEAFDHYLNIVKATYTPISYLQWNTSGSNGAVLWRHDVDISLNRALALAVLEHKHGISATYFIRLRGGGYNVLEDNQLLLVKRIMDYGHHVGLHFDHSSYVIGTEESLNEALEKDKSLLQQVIEAPIDVFSFHDPTPTILTFDSLRYAGMLNTYAKPLRDSFRYVSDSNGYWRHDELQKVLSQPDRQNVQVLTHPEWWQDKPMAPFDRVKRCSEGRAKSFVQNYVTALEQSSRNNLGSSNSEEWNAQPIDF
jgi:hypothetical protein